ncbi:MAG: hypothetical protein WC209_08325 [Ignavibacteriaceae bacterium]|jgi:hypothetical protein
MKIFNAQERKYIHLINSTNEIGRSIIDIFDNDLTATRLKLNKTDKTAVFKFELEGNEPNDKESDWIIAKIHELQYKIVILTNLIHYLENNGLLTTYTSHSSVDNEITFGQGAEDSVAVNYSFSDSKIIDLLIQYIDKRLLPSVELKELEKHKFKSSEERKFFKEQLVAWAAIIVAILLGLWGIFWNVLDSSNDNLRKDVKQEIMLLNDSLSSKLNGIKTEILSKDSLTIILVQPNNQNTKK